MKVLSVMTRLGISGGAFLALLGGSLTFAQADEAAVSLFTENPGFESGTWKPAASDATAGLSKVIPDAAHTGQQGMRIEQTVDQTGSWVNSPKILLPASGKYRVDFWVRTLKASKVEVFVKFYDANGSNGIDTAKPPANMLQIPDGIYDWTECHFEVVAPDGAAVATLAVHANSNTECQADFDDFSFTPEGPPASAGTAPAAVTSGPAAATTTTSSAASLLTENPGFESGTWKPSQSDSDNGLSKVIPEAAHTGQEGLRVQQTADQAGSWVDSPKVQIAAPGVYQVAFWVRTLKASKAGVFVKFYDANGSGAIDTAKPPQNALQIPDGIYDWTECHFEVQAPAGAAVAVISLHAFSKTECEADFDDFTFVPEAPVVGKTAPSATAPPQLQVRTDHKNGIYGPDEKVAWTVDVAGDRSQLATAVYAYSVKKDGQVEVGNGTVDLSSGPATITASRSDPGILVAQIFPSGNANGQPLAVGGAVISPEKINLAIPSPADFDLFWQAKLKELAAVPVNPALEKVDVSALPSAQDLDYYKVTLDNVGGTHVYGQLARPKSGDKFPAMLMLQFAGVYPLDKNQVLAQAKLGWLVLNISAHDAPIDGTPDFYNQLKQTTLKDYPFLGAENRDTSYFLRMFLGCARAVDYLTSRSDWNGKILLVTGTSQGGFQSFATAVLRPQVTAVSVNVPAGCDLTGPLAASPRAFGWPYWISNWGPAGRDQKKVAETAGYYDGINFAARIKCPTLVAVGLIDDTARPTGVIAAYNGIKAPKQLVIMPLSDHRGSGGSQGDYYRAFVAWRTSIHDEKPLPTTDGLVSSN